MSTVLDRSSTEYLDRVASELYSSVLSDILDDLGHRHQVLRPEVRAVYPGARLAGRAATMLAVAVSELPAEPYKLLLELLDSINPGEVVMAAVQGDTKAAVWGELLSTHTRARGGRGVVIDGLTRDTWGIADMKFPVFAKGVSPADSKGRLEVIAIREPILVGDVAVTPGDLVLADEDGVVVVPATLEEAVIGRAFDKVAGENTIRDILARGANLKKVFLEHGIL